MSATIRSEPCCVVVDKMLIFVELLMFFKCWRKEFAFTVYCLGMSLVKSSTKIFLSVNIEKFFGKSVKR